MNGPRTMAALRRLAKEPTYSAYNAVASALEQEQPDSIQSPSLRVAILRNFTVDPLVPVLKGEVRLAGFHPELYLGNYDTIMQDVLSSDSDLYAFKPDFIIIAQWLEVLAPGLVTRFISFSPEQVASEVERVLATIDKIVTTLRQQSEAPILINNFPFPVYPAYGILDAQSENYQTQTVLRLNLSLTQRLRQLPNVYLVDYMSLMARIGSIQGLDERYWQIGQAPIGRQSLVPLGQEYGKFFRALRGKTRKCLVLDCDNILWGGILGEDGLSGIKLGQSYPGSCYRAFQQEILNLHDRGVILALCSKNNETDVLEVLQSHSEMVLGESNFATWQINWDDKATNLVRIAKGLNIGLDSLVFVDDSRFECDMVRERLPEVAVLHLSSDTPSSFKSKLSATAYFDSLTLSTEDRDRNQMYRVEVQRKQLYELAGSLEEYLSRLEMVAEIGLADEMTIPRIAQLTQKTNQFNLTTHRYSEGDIHTFVESDEADVFYLRLRDRVSDLGLIGVAIVRYFGTRADIDSFLLSCRAIGRGVEKVLLTHVLNTAKTKGCKHILGYYRVTTKNEQVSDFFPQHGFQLVSENQNGSDWQLLLNQDIFSPPNWIDIELIEKEIDDAS